MNNAKVLDLRYEGALQECGAFFLTHPLSSAEALAKVNFLLPPAGGKDDSFEGC
jgi:hypothetical protein